MLQYQTQPSEAVPFFLSESLNLFVSYLHIARTGLTFSGLELPLEVNIEPKLLGVSH